MMWSGDRVWIENWSAGRLKFEMGVPWENLKNPDIIHKNWPIDDTKIRTRDT